ncbi:MAG TPA: aldo/keto reductase [Caulobacteraceae bacterium]|nr:aldo/keto reductase [Caulobacteraceae bacterium]
MIAAEELDRIIFGCGNFGGLGSSPALRDKGDDASQSLAILDEARALGVTRFDTANTYGGGASEAVLGEWLARQDSTYRARIEVASKVGNPVGCPPGDRPLSRGQMALHLEESLRRLRMERIDLYYLHEFDPSTPLQETLEALDRALAAGKIAAFGVSNATASDLRAVLALADGALRRAFTHVQNEFSLLATDDQAEVIPLVRAEGLRYSAFSPLSGGLLTGKYAYGRAAGPGTRLGAAPDLYDHRLTPETFAAIARLETRAADRGWTLPGAALRFVLDTPGVDSLIIAPRSATQFAGYGIARG